MRHSGDIHSNGQRDHQITHRMRHPGPPGPSRLRQPRLLSLKLHTAGLHTAGRSQTCDFENRDSVRDVGRMTTVSPPLIERVQESTESPACGSAQTGGSCGSASRCASVEGTNSKLRCQIGILSPKYVSTMLPRRVSPNDVSARLLSTATPI